MGADITARPAAARTTGPTDAELIASSLTRPDAFAGLLDRHGPLIGSWLGRRVGPDLADDLLAETFTRAFDARTRFDPNVSTTAKPWLFGIAANLVASHNRTERRNLHALARAERWERSVDEDMADAAVARAGAAADGPLIATALRALRPQERSVLLLYAWADLDYQEIADALGIPIGTVRSRLSRARSRLHKTLDRPEDDR